MCVALFCLSPGAYAQQAPGEPDLFSLTFAPAPVSSEAQLRSSGPDTGAGDDLESNDGRRGRALETIAQIQAAIREEESLNGSRSSDLVGHLTALAASYQDIGEHVLALAALERANRIPHSLDQTAIVDRMIDSMEALERFSESDALQDSLLALALESQGDPRVPLILADVADRQMDAVQAYVQEGIWRRSRAPFEPTEGSLWDPIPPMPWLDNAASRLIRIKDSHEKAIEEALTSNDYEVGAPLELEAELDEVYRLVDMANALGEHESFWEPEIATSDQELALAALRRARRLYVAATRAALDGRNREEYLKVEEQLVATYYFERAHPTLHGSSCDSWCSGAPTFRHVLQTRVIERLTRGESAVDAAQALLELADLYSNSAALKWYQRTYDLLVKEDASAETIAAMFSPETPAIRPALSPDDFVEFDPARTYRGYVDVSIEIGRYGETKEVEVLSASPDTARAVARRLRTHVLKTRFRPRFVDGKPARSDDFSLRYYYDYDTLE